MAKTTVESLVQTIKTDLGDGRLGIHLPPDAFKRGIEAAIQLLSTYRPEEGYVLVPVQQDMEKVKLDVVNWLGEVDVQFFAPSNRMEAAPYRTRWSDRMAELLDMSSTARVFGDEPIYRIEMEYDSVSQSHQPYFYASVTQSSFGDTYFHQISLAMIKYYWHIDVSNDPKTGVGRIPYDLLLPVTEYATAHCRSIQADVLSRFGGVPSGGSVMPTDGPMQKAQAEKDKERIRKDLRERCRLFTPTYI